MKVEAHFDEETGKAILQLVLEPKEGVAMLSLIGWSGQSANEAYVADGEGIRALLRKRDNKKDPLGGPEMHPDGEELVEFMDDLMTSLWRPMWTKFMEEQDRRKKSDPTKAESEEDEDF